MVTTKKQHRTKKKTSRSSHLSSPPTRRKTGTPAGSIAKRGIDARYPWKEEPNPYIELRTSKIQGTGAFAARAIRKGTRIIEYVGQRISWRTADKRYDDDTMGRHHTFLFTVDEKTCIDGAVQGNVSRFINHSCDGNCDAINDRKRIFIDALRNIRKGEELAYDYQYERTDDHTKEDERFYKCRCGTAKCRGSILAPKESDD